MIPPCLTLSSIRYISRVKWSNPGKGVASSPTTRCRSYWKGSDLVALDYGRQLLIFWLEFHYCSVWQWIILNNIRFNCIFLRKIISLYVSFRRKLAFYEKKKRKNIPVALLRSLLDKYPWERFEPLILLYMG